MVFHPAFVKGFLSCFFSPAVVEGDAACESQNSCNIAATKIAGEHNFFYSRRSRDLARFQPRSQHGFFVKFVQHRPRVEGRCGPKRPFGLTIFD